MNETCDIKLNEVCRVCLSKIDNMMNIIETNTHNSNIISMLQSIGHFEIVLNDFLPKYLCKECEKQLELSYNFQKTLQKNNEYLMECFNEKFLNISKTLDSQFIKTEVESLKTEIEIPKEEPPDLDNQETKIPVNNDNDERIDTEEKDQLARKRRMNREQQAKWKAKQSEESLARLRERNAECQRKRYQRRTHEQKASKRSAHAEYHQERSASMTPEQLAAYSESDAVAQQKYTEVMTNSQLVAASQRKCVTSVAAEQLSLQLLKTEIEIPKDEPPDLDSQESKVPVNDNNDERIDTEEDRLARKRRLNRERQARWKARQSEEVRARLREKNNACHRNRYRKCTLEQKVEKRSAHAKYQRERFASMTPEQLAAYRQSHAAAQQKYIEGMTSSQLAAHRAANAASQRKRVASMSEQQLSLHRAANAAAQRKRVASMNHEQLFLHRAANAAAQRKRIVSKITEQITE